jgi:hypothetical protein
MFYVTLLYISLITTMKKLTLLLSLAVLLIAGSACRRGHRTVIVTKDDHDYLKVAYSGIIMFNDDDTGILHISPGGYFECKDNYDNLLIEPDAKGELTYQVNREDAKRSLDNSGYRILLRRAVKEIAKQQGHTAQK